MTYYVPTVPPSAVSETTRKALGQNQKLKEG